MTAAIHLFLLARALAFLETILPCLFFVSAAFVRPPLLLPSFPRQTRERAARLLIGLAAFRRFFVGFFLHGIKFLGQVPSCLEVNDLLMFLVD